MPNWCDNGLVITGNAKDIAKFKKQARDVKWDFSFEPFIPMPAELVDTLSPGKPNKKLLKLYGASNWYEWKLKNLGTKWDVEGEISIDEKTQLGYTFMSAWSPPDEGVRKISELYPKLHFSLDYDEPGMDFAGVDEIENGEFVSRTQTKSPQNREDHGGN